MSIPLQPTLKLMRKERDRIVLTEHPDSIHPADLRDYLVFKYGTDHHRTFLIKNIYLIYVDRTVVNMADFCTDAETEAETNPIQQKHGDDLKPDFGQILSDVCQAKDLLKEARNAKRDMGRSAK
ncbi:hypothetical protein F5Y10DRAFT_234589 [Nemania abortiva]|nr:hypothetical protein F5Y10DRAFT_234589 [Nemania abortiva]